MRSVSDPKLPVASVRILGGVHAVAGDGSLIDLPSASQRRLLAILALHSPRRLRSEWLADVLDITPGGLRTSVSRVRATVGTGMLETTSTGYALVGDVDTALFCRAVAEGRAFEPGFEQAAQWARVQDALLRSARSGQWEDVRAPAEQEQR